MGFRVDGSGFRSLGFGVYGLGFRIQDLDLGWQVGKLSLKALVYAVVFYIGGCDFSLA